MTAVVELVDAGLTYGTATGRGRGRVVRAVRGVSARIDSDSAIAVTGPSGSGKSSLLHLVAGLESPSEGRVRAAAGPALTSEVAMLFQAPSLIAGLDVGENVALPLVARGVPAATADEAAAAVLAELGLEQLRQADAEEVSGGQAQRVALARALVTDPRLLVADEPTGQLDDRTADQVLDLLLARHRSGRLALLVSTHDPRVAGRFPTTWRMTDGHVEVTA